MLQYRWIFPSFLRRWQRRNTGRHPIRKSGSQDKGVGLHYRENHWPRGFKESFPRRTAGRPAQISENRCPVAKVRPGPRAFGLRQPSSAAPRCAGFSSIRSAAGCPQGPLTDGSSIATRPWPPRPGSTAGPPGSVAGQVQPSRGQEGDLAH
jgi:hypothetical protein